MSHQHDAGKFLIGKKRLLTLCGTSSAGIGLLMLSLSLSTNNWITTYERLTKYNRTTIVAINSGLWRKCWRSREVTGISKATVWSEDMKEFSEDVERNCSFISYFKDKSKSTGELRAPEGILYEMRTAAIFPIIGFVALLIGCSISALSYCDMKLKKCIFIASGFYVLSGVFLLIGIVLYVGSISQAFDSKNNDSDSESQYYYDYGLSFYLSVISFILTEFSGVFYIYLYIAKRKHQSKKVIISEEIKKDKNDEASVNCLTFNRNRDWNVIDDRSERSPISQLSQQSYTLNRRCSDQMLLKLQHADAASIQFQPQYSFSTPQHETFLRYPIRNNSNNQFTAEYRADNPSPLLQIAIHEPQDNVVINSSRVFFNKNNHISSPEEAFVTSLILNKCTYFDSPIEEVHMGILPISSNFICKICNLPGTLCNCNCAFMFNHKNSNNIKQNDVTQTKLIEKQLLMSKNMMRYMSFSSNTLTNNASKTRKITAV